MEALVRGKRIYLAKSASTKTFLGSHSHQISTCCTRPRLLGNGRVVQDHGRLSLGWSRRGAKKRATAFLDDLPQGAIAEVEDIPQGGLPADLVERVPIEDVKEYPTVIQQAQNNMRKFSDCVVLTRVGGFYEMYLEHADRYGPLLNLKVAEKRTSKGPVSMAGFPFYQLDRYLKILVQDMSQHVAISEEQKIDQSKRIKTGGLLFDRKVTRVVTPGTLIDEHFIDPGRSNYLLSVFIESRSAQTEIIDGSDHDLDVIGLAWLDLSSGDFSTQITTFAALPSAITRIGPKELILDRNLSRGTTSTLLRILERDGHSVTLQDLDPETTIDDWLPMLEEAVDGFDGSGFSPVEVAAGGCLLHYVQEQLQGLHTRLQMPTRHTATDYMMIDKATFRALEIRTTLRDRTEAGSLLHALKRTVTPSGTRLLTNRLAEPSTSLDVINERLDLVSFFIHESVLAARILALLDRTYDTPRLVSKFTLGRGDADDLVSLSRTIEVTSDISELLRDTGTESNVDSSEPFARSLQTLVERLSLDEPIKLAARINRSIDEEGLYQQHEIEQAQEKEMAGIARGVIEKEASTEEMKMYPKRIQPLVRPRIISSSAMSGSSTEPFIMRPKASTKLRELHGELDTLSTQVQSLRTQLRDSLGAESLDLKWTPGQGHIVHVRRKDVAKVAALKDAYSVSSSQSTGSFKVQSWTDLGEDLDSVRLRIRKEEENILNALRTQVVKNLVNLRRNAHVLAELDVACGFATLAREKLLTRPILNAGTAHHIVGGRHLVVEAGLTDQGRSFTSNNCFVGDPAKIWLITGPNMAGKSTFLRQNAQISILAQTGSFVPADYAEIGIVDKIFTRVGSADNLYQDQSTFMVEMSETAEILREATSKSFVVMDEVGRGTTPEDGIAVGYACLDHLRRINQCRTIFATHFHALADMTQTWEERACYCSDVAEESDGSFAYVHRLTEGVNRQSHALKVARMAGLPEEAIATAKQVLDQLQVPTASIESSAVGHNAREAHQTVSVAG